MVNPSLSIIETTGPFFALALVVAVLLRSGVESERDLVPPEPPPGRFAATVLQNDSTTALKGDALFSIRARSDRPTTPSGASPGASAGDTTLVSDSVATTETRFVLSSDARFAPPRPRPDSAVASPRPDSARLSSPVSAASLPAERVSPDAPRIALTLPARMADGERFTLNASGDSSPPPLHYFPAGPCSIPFEMIRGTVESSASNGRVQGTVRGSMRRVDVYRPAPSLGCRAPALVPLDPSETLSLYVRFLALPSSGPLD